jgi:hypothetical protein
MLIEETRQLPTKTGVRLDDPEPELFHANPLRHPRSRERPRPSISD